MLILVVVYTTTKTVCEMLVLAIAPLFCVFFVHSITRKRDMCLFVALFCALMSLVLANQVLGPSPSVLYVPAYGTATFACSYASRLQMYH